MEIEEFTTKQFERLEPLKLADDVTSIESNLFKLPEKVNVNKKVLKRYKKIDGNYFGNKLLTINALIDYKDQIGIEELVYPEKVAVVNKELVGFTMELIENNHNLSTLLNSKEITTREKIKLLKQVESIIEKVQYIKDLSKPFYLADIHESNFILNNDDKKVYAVDLDGCKISNNEIFTMKYGSFNEKFFEFPHKYPLDECDNPIPNANTEWYCFAIMILNTITDGPFYKLTLEDFYNYMFYLKRRGFPNELLDYFNSIYCNSKNYAPKDILDLIPNDLNKFSFSEFLDETGKKEKYKLYKK